MSLYAQLARRLGRNGTWRKWASSLLDRAPALKYWLQRGLSGANSPAPPPSALEAWGLDEANTPRGPLSISIVSTWAEACGIAEYSARLTEELIAAGDEVEVIAPRGRTDHTRLAQLPAVAWREAWTHGQAMDALPAAARGRIVWLQHQAALFELGDALAQGVAACQAEGRRVFITLHGTRYLRVLAAHRRRAARDTLNLMDGILVHARDDVRVLAALGVTAPLAVVPHGMQAPAGAAAGPPGAGGCAGAADAPWTVGCFGFLLPHKGVGLLLRAFAEFAAARPGHEHLRLRLVNALHDDPLSHTEHARCLALARELGVERRVEWHTGFLPASEVAALLGGCDLVVLPYQFTSESASGAARNALAACADVATTPAPIFDELRGITHAIGGYDARAILHLLERAHAGFDPATLERVHAGRLRWMADNTWQGVARRCRRMFHAAMQSTTTS